MDTSPIEIWTTVAVTPLPSGWRNGYRLGGEIFIYPCPAVLLQEKRETSRFRVTESGREVWNDSTLDPPYETRAVFAENDRGTLDPATDTDNYIGTIGPDEDLDALLKGQTPGEEGSCDHS
ncbi:hypothetical protein [Nonomuraea insulae]|uniref:Uncharacterized protein n=1 Tax=Nonomuraea insulae TaxID=1616787 RepID=A0ABW1D9Y0_9ACTN